VVLLLVGMGIRGAVLPLEADGLVDEEVAAARVDGSADGKSNDDACDLYQYGCQNTKQGATVVAHRGETTRGGSASGGGDAAKRCALWFDGVCVSLHILHDLMHSGWSMLSSGLSSPNWPHVPDCSSFCTSRVSPDAIHQN